MPALALFLNDESKHILPAIGKWYAIILAADSGISNVARFISFVPYISVCNSYVQSGLLNSRNAVAEMNAGRAA
jgi:hypothetical protein